MLQGATSKAMLISIADCIVHLQSLAAESRISKVRGLSCYVLLVIQLLKMLKRLKFTCLRIKELRSTKSMKTYQMKTKTIENIAADLCVYQTFLAKPQDQRDLRAHHGKLLAFRDFSVTKDCTLKQKKTWVISEPRTLMDHSISTLPLSSPRLPDPRLTSENSLLRLNSSWCLCVYILHALRAWTVAWNILKLCLLFTPPQRWQVHQNLVMSCWPLNRTCWTGKLRNWMTQTVSIERPQRFEIRTLCCALTTLSPSDLDSGFQSYELFGSGCEHQNQCRKRQIHLLYQILELCCSRVSNIAWCFKKRAHGNKRNHLATPGSLGNTQECCAALCVYLCFSGVFPCALLSSKSYFPNMQA